jgi:NADPH2:quinone reductase
VDAVIEMDFTANARLYPACVRPGATIVVYGMGQAEATLPTFWFMRNRIRIQFVFVYELEPAERAACLRELDALLREGTLQHTVALRLPLAEIARAHDIVERGELVGNLVLDIP